MGSQSLLSATPTLLCDLWMSRSQQTTRPASPLVSCTGCLLVKCSAFVPPSLVNHGMWLWTCSSTVILRRQRSNLRKLKLQLKLPRLLPRSMLHPPVMGMHQCSQLQCQRPQHSSGLLLQTSPQATQLSNSGKLLLPPSGAQRLLPKLLVGKAPFSHYHFVVDDYHQAN